MNIVLINNLYGANARGGAERVVEEEANMLREAGHEVSVIFSSKSAHKNLEGSEDSHGIMLYSFRPRNIYFYADGAQYSFFTRLLWHVIDTFNIWDAYKIIQLLKQIQPDVVHTHNLMGVGFMLPRLLKIFGFKHVHTVHDVQLLHPSGLLPSPNDWSLGLKMLVRINIWVMRLCFGSPRTVIFPSLFMQNLHHKYSFFKQSDKIILSNNAPIIDSDLGASVAFFGRSYCIDQKKSTGACSITYLYAGQLETHKGILFLLDAWYASNRDNNCKLQIAGAGSLADLVKERVYGLKESVEFLGHLNPDQLMMAINVADFLVFPSLVIENSPRIILESLAIGTPVIAANIGGVAELVGDNQEGILFESGNRQSFLDAMDRSKNIDYKKISECAISKAKQFSRQVHLKSLLEVYRD